MTIVVVFYIDHVLLVMSIIEHFLKNTINFLILLGNAYMSREKIYLIKYIFMAVAYFSKLSLTVKCYIVFMYLLPLVMFYLTEDLNLETNLFVLETLMLIQNKINI